jgi:hypothetical protein
LAAMRRASCLLSNLAAELLVLTVSPNQRLSPGHA